MITNCSKIDYKNKLSKYLGKTVFGIVIDYDFETDYYIVFKKGSSYHISPHIKIYFDDNYVYFTLKDYDYKNEVSRLYGLSYTLFETAFLNGRYHFNFRDNYNFDLITEGIIKTILS